MARGTAKRLDTSVTDAPTVDKASRLMAMLDTGNADLFRGALDVFDWCVRQVREGRHIVATDDSGRSIELATPLLEAARGRDRIVLGAAAFDEVVRLVERAPAPTAELRELMAETYAE